MTHFPQAILHGLASVTLAHSALAAQPAANPGTTYNITQYAFTDSETNKYDPVLNEQYLFSTISFDGQSARRIDMLGNPNTYTDSPSGDVDKSGNPVTQIFSTVMLIVIRRLRKPGRQILIFSQS